MTVVHADKVLYALITRLISPACLPRFYAASDKSPGSAFPVVVIPVAMQHFMMLRRNLIYTDVTRG